VQYTNLQNNVIGVSIKAKLHKEAVMDLSQVIRDRRSIRKFKDLPVEWEKIEQVLNAARLAPSWKNQQCWRFLVLTDPVKRASLLAAFPEENPGKKAIALAPCVIVVCADPAESGVENGIEYFIADTAIAFEHLCLAACELGLGTCWMGMFDEGAVKAVLGIPAGIRIVGITPLGYPDQEPRPRPRKELAEIAYLESWGESC
jgi:nitroreductase